MKELFREIEIQMKHAVDHFHNELKHLRTGRASLTLLDGVTVDYYGTPTPLNQLANLSVADAGMIVVQPYDPSQIAAIPSEILMATGSSSPIAIAMAMARRGIKARPFRPDENSNIAERSAAAGTRGLPASPNLIPDRAGACVDEPVASIRCKCR